MISITKLLTIILGISLVWIHHVSRRTFEYGKWWSTFYQVLLFVAVLFQPALVTQVVNLTKDHHWVLAIQISSKKWNDGFIHYTTVHYNDLSNAVMVKYITPQYITTIYPMQWWWNTLHHSALQFSIHKSTATFNSLFNFLLSACSYEILLIHFRPLYHFAVQFQFFS